VSVFPPFLIRFLWRLPVGKKALLRLREAKALRWWLAEQSGFAVPFGSFEEARKAPAKKPIGYETCAPDVYRIFAEKLIPGDYPAMFWLQQLVKSDTRIFDYGGNIGTQFYSYSSYMKLPADLSWTVCDIDPFVTEGRRMAAAKSAKQLHFCYELAEGSGAELFLVSGSLHYLETKFGDQLKTLAELPKHLVINRIPVIAGPDTVTLQDIGSTLLPVVIRNRNQFVQNIEAAGYALRDEWDVPELQCKLPLYPELSATSYTGFYFHRRA
jgi:putative methyltransferase (TIGR04325 family)